MVFKYYPVLLKLSGRLCVVIGGGKVAERKVKSLLECEASIRLISPDLTPGLAMLVNKKMIDYKQGNYTDADLDGAFLVIAATNKKEVNDSVYAECLKKRILINVVDAPSKTNFIVPSTMRTGSLSISVSTDGKSPLMARLIREELESFYTQEFGLFLDFLADIREQVIVNFQDKNIKQKIFSNLVDKETFRLLRQGYLEKAKERVNCVYNSYRS